MSDLFNMSDFEKGSLLITGNNYTSEFMETVTRKFAYERMKKTCNTHSVRCKIEIDKNNIVPLFNDVIEKIRKKFGDFAVITLNRHGCILISDALLVTIENEHENTYRIKATGDYSKVVDFHNDSSLNEKDDDNKYISWFYTAANGSVYERSLKFVFEHIAEDYHYPYIEEGVDKYIESFLNSTADLIILSGEPGTGKTTFIKHMIKKFDREAMIAYDEKTISSDTFLLDFLTSDESDLLVIEDSDALLKSREHDGNKVISKLLNVSDGLLKLMDGKKIVLTTNLTKLDDVDTAITRPGRCFDVLNFRSLTHEEMKKVVSEHEMTDLPYVKSHYTLAEIFNRKEAYKNNKDNKVGFIGA